jgi:hypothetical protein
MTTETTHMLFCQFSCGHEYSDKRVPGGVSDWENCLCDSCQPYHAIIVVDHRCRLCADSFQYFKDAPQIRLSEQEATRRMKRCVPLFGKKAQTVTAFCQSS